MKEFKQLLKESNEDYYDQFRHQPDDDDGDAHDQEERAVTAAHRIMSEETLKMHRSPIPFRYDTIAGPNRRLTFNTLHDAMAAHTTARVAQLAAHGFLTHASIPTNQQEQARLEQTMQRIHDSHSHLFEELMRKSVERSRELYRTNSHFKLAMDKLKSYYGVDHDEMYKREFEDRMNEDHVAPQTFGAVARLRSSSGEEFRQYLANRMNEAIMKHGGSIGIIIDNPISSRRNPRVEHL